jgi:hypothetical protein
MVHARVLGGEPVCCPRTPHPRPFPMDTSTDDARLNAALDELRAGQGLLRDVLAYLERLPPVPVTRDFCKQLRARLDAPAQAATSTWRRELHGIGPYTAAGLPLLEASLVEDELRVWVPVDLKGASRDFAVQEICRRLATGTMCMSVRERTTDEALQPRSQPPKG